MKNPSESPLWATTSSLLTMFPNDDEGVFPRVNVKDTTGSEGSVGTPE